MDRWLTCYPLPGKSSAQGGKPYSSGEARIAVSSREELAALSGRFFGWGILCRFYAGGAHVFILVRFSDIWHTHCAATLFPAWQEDIAASDTGGKSSNLAAFPFPLDLAAFPFPSERREYAGIPFSRQEWRIRRQTPFMRPSECCCKLTTRAYSLVQFCILGV